MHRNNIVWTVAGILIVSLPLVIYVIGYFTLGEYEWFTDGPQSDVTTDVAREYPSEWMARVFEPAAWIEQSVRGIPVEAFSREP